MSLIVSVAGSPSHPAKSTFILRHALQRIERGEIETGGIVVRDLPPEDLLYARIHSPSIQEASTLIGQADGVLIGTPIYKAAYSGVLKAFLDLLPPAALRGKVVLPLATGGSAHHLLALDYALKPVLSALGASHILPGVFITDSQILFGDDGNVELEEGVQQRLHDSLDDLVSVVQHGERLKSIAPT